MKTTSPTPTAIRPAVMVHTRNAYRSVFAGLLKVRGRFGPIGRRFVEGISSLNVSRDRSDTVSQGRTWRRLRGGGARVGLGTRLTATER